MFGPARLLVVLLALATLAQIASAQCAYTMTSKHCYAPDEVADAGFGSGVPHDLHELTIFLPGAGAPTPPDAPVNPSTGETLYPTLLYSPAGIFAQVAEGNPSVENLFGQQPPLPKVGTGYPANIRFNLQPGQMPPLPAEGTSPSCGFIATALLSGWAVVSVGSTGWNSWPTCLQNNDCNNCLNDPAEDPLCTATAACRDTNLWIDPDSPEWDDFNIFSGEKEFTWARQWIGEFGADHRLDTDRVVACGTSTGAIYSAFLAFGPNRAWGPGESLPGQSRQDTRVAAMVAFEPNIWVHALDGVRPSLHWPSDDTGLICPSTGLPCVQGAACSNTRAAGMIDAVPAIMNESSISRWVHEIEGDESPTPLFIAAGDSNFTTDFKRNANDPMFPIYMADYARHIVDLGCGFGFGPPGDALELADPLLRFTSGAGELNLHDSWNAVNLRIDLSVIDILSGNTFHDQRSRLYLQDTQTFSNLPPCLSTVPGMPPSSAAEVTVLDGTFPDYFPFSSIDNVFLAPDIVTWMEAVIGVQRGAGVVSRNPLMVGAPGFKVPNTNFNIYEGTTAWDGLPVPIEIDLNNTGYDEAAVLFFTASYPACGEVVLSGGQTLMCDIGTLQDFDTGFKAADLDGIVRHTLGAGTPPGTFFCTQAILRDTTGVGNGGKVFGLSNAVDLTVQYLP